MQIRNSLLMIALLLACSSAAAKEKDATPQFKTAEAKHFTQVEGVELSPAFGDYFYAELREELKKAKLAGEVIGEGETVDDADAAHSIVVTGTITEYKKGSVVKSALIGFGAGMRSLKMDADVLKRNDNQHLGVVHVHVKIDPRWDEKTMAKFAAHQLVKEMKEALKAQAK
ncbi:MAG: DUF4410 domain-containing protein [Terriglobales bacterium]